MDGGIEHQPIKRVKMCAFYDLVGVQISVLTRFFKHFVWLGCNVKAFLLSCGEKLVRLRCECNFALGNFR